jgi:hypothetical protein
MSGSRHRTHKEWLLSDPGYRAYHEFWGRYANTPTGWVRELAIYLARPDWTDDEHPAVIADIQAQMRRLADLDPDKLRLALIVGRLGPSDGSDRRRGGDPVP